VVDVFIYLSSCILGCGRQTTPILLQGDLFFNLKLKLFGSTGTAGGLLADTKKIPEENLRGFLLFCKD